MAKNKQPTVKQRYTIQCRPCKKKWEANEISQCIHCGGVKLFADDHERAYSRYFINGVMCES